MNELHLAFSKLTLSECLPCSQNKNATNNDKYSSAHSQSSSIAVNNDDGDFDDFDPRGTSTASEYSELMSCALLLLIF